MRARRRHVLAHGLAAVAAAGGLVLAGWSVPAVRSNAGTVAAQPGARLWLSHLAGPGQAGDHARAVAVSPDGAAVFVTGTFGLTGEPSEGDFGTIGYSAATGKLLWVSKYDGIGGPDEATAIAVSPDGRTVFVSGESDGPPKDHGKSNAIATVADNAATGKQLWVRRYNGHGTFDNFDFAKAVVVSPDGRTVFVTGQASVKKSISGYTTIAYGTVTGKQEWVSNYEATGGWANAQAISPDGRTLFVTGDLGRPSGGAGYGTIAYDASTGARRWITVDTAPTGDTQANAVQVSPDGRTVFVTGETDNRFKTVAYNAASGAQRWVSYWQRGAGKQAIATAIGVSPGGGTVYVTGYATTTFGNQRPQIVTVGYNSRTGGRLWVGAYQAPGTCRNVPVSIAVGPGGRTVFVGGDSTIPEPAGNQPCDAGLDTIAYRAATGKQLWLSRVRAVKAFAGGLAVSRRTDRVIITGGISPRPHTATQYATAAYHG